MTDIETNEKLLLSQDAEYVLLIESYQNADWLQCQIFAKSLLEKYPNVESFREFVDDIELKLLFYNKSEQNKEEGKKRHVLTTVFHSLLVLSGIILGYVLYSSFETFLSNKLTLPEAVLATQPSAQVLDDLESQAFSLLDIGNAPVAEQVIEQIREIDSQYPAIPTLEYEVVLLSELEEQYNFATQLLSQNNYADALIIFNQIQVNSPHYKDVEYQIAQIQNQIHKENLILVAESSFQQQNWEAAIDAYEQLLQIPSDTYNLSIKENLFICYYNRVNEILNSPSISLQDVDKAEEYYLKAIALFPGSNDFSNEKQNLSLLVNDLIVVKYINIAQELINRKDASESTVSAAIVYFQKALDISPEDSSIKTNLQNAQTYSTGLQRFYAFDWDNAIVAFEQLIYFDPNYADGMVNNLLYESYSSRGRKYYTVGYYNDALANFEAAELVAWKDPENMLQFFSSQIDMGLVYGKLHNFQKASEYFHNVLRIINATSRFMDDNLTDQLNNAQRSYEAQNYIDAFNQYKEALTDPSIFFTYQDVFFNKGESLASIAILYDSTVNSIIEANDISPSCILQNDMVLRIPVIE